MNAQKSTRFKLKWTKLDIIAISITFIIATLASIFVFFLPTAPGASVSIYYDGKEIVSLPLEPQDGETDPRYIILFKNEKSDKWDEKYPTKYKYENLSLLLDDLIIEINNKSISIVEETSPNNICSKQGSVSRPNIPLTCAPNYIVAMITTDEADDGEIII